MAHGQFVLLWVSGRDPAAPAGIYASGCLIGPVREEILEVPVALRPVEPPVLRTELLGDPVLSRIEVLRMPAGSNPSYLTAEEVARLRAGWPQVRDR